MIDIAENFSDIDEDDLRNRIARGDYLDPKILNSASRALKIKERQAKFEAKCKAAGISAALDAKQSASRANVVAVISICVALVAARKDLFELIQSLASAYK